MFRRLPAAAALLALVLAAEPLLHNHPLQGRGATNNSATCAVCVSAAHRLPSTSPVVAAPQCVVALFISGETRLIAAAIPLPRASRAPPAAA